jgi:hypothetical protein
MDPTLVDSDVLGLRFVREVDVLGLRTWPNSSQEGRILQLTVRIGTSTSIC